MAELSQRDLDLLVRTVAGEDPTSDGQAAVAHVVMNRLASGRYGKTPGEIVLAPNQFEPWAARPRELLGMRPDSPQYQQALAAVNGVLNGDTPDPTNGATHFFAPKAQAALGRNPPAWAVQNQPTARVGAHVYYAPHGETDGMMIVGQPRSPQADNAPNLGSPTLPAMAYAPTQKAPEMPKAKDDGSLFSHLGIDPPKGEDAAPSSDSLFAHLGMDAPAPAKAPVSSGDLQGVALGTGLVNGIPIVGPAILGGLEKTGAAANAVLNNSRYSDELAAIQKRAADAEAQHGTASTAGNIAGAVAGYTAGGIPAIGARALGMTGASLAGRAALGGTTNALIGGIDAAARGEDAAKGAMWGAGGGLAGPYAGKVVGRVLESAGDGIRSILPTSVPGVSRPAANALNKLIVADDPAAVRAALAQHGDLAMLSDAGPSLNQITGGLAAQPNEAQGIVRGALDARQRGAVNRLTEDINSAVGPAPIPSQVEAGIDAARQVVGPEYDRVLAGARAVDTTPLANRLDSSVADLRGASRKAVEQVRGFLNIPGTNQLDPNPKALHATREAIDGMMKTEADPKAIRQLEMARQQVDAELARAVPGIKDVDAKYAELQRQSTALDTGKNLLDSGKTAVRPQELAESFPQSALPQGTMVGPSAAPLRTQQGVRGEIDRLVGTKANDLSALKTMLQGEGGWNTNKLTTVFGEEPTNRLLGAVQREAQFADTANTVTRNSESVRRNEASKFLKDAEPGSLNFTGATVTGLGLQAAKKWIADPLVRTIMESSSAPMQAEMARVLTMQGASRDQVLSRLLALHAREQGVSAIGEAAGRIGRGATNRLLGAAGGTSQR